MMVLGQQVSVIATTELPLFSDHQIDLIVVGGGASGFMGAITAAEEGVSSVIVLEASAKPLDKVRISGGGRCNVTNACWDIMNLVENYPRGRNPLFGLFSRFSTADVVSWFNERGLDLVVESDGRMFPSSHSSLAVIDCLMNSAEKAGVVLKNNTQIIDIKCLGRERFLVQSSKDCVFSAKNILLATGGHPLGRKLAQGLGHTIVPAVPSLFSLRLDSPCMASCSGIAIDNVQLTLISDCEKFQEKGRVLLTHKGISGPAVLRLTAFAARHLNTDGYRAEVVINWLANLEFNSIIDLFHQLRSQNASHKLGRSSPFESFPKRFWISLLHQASIDSSIRWGEFSAQMERSLLKALVSSKYLTSGRGPYGEEFVTAGGVVLKEVYLDRMESRLCKGLYFAGELLDIDGVTGGFNFQHCWTSGWIAGRKIANNS